MIPHLRAEVIAKGKKKDLYPWRLIASGKGLAFSGLFHLSPGPGVSTVLTNRGSTISPADSYSPLLAEIIFIVRFPVNTFVQETKRSAGRRQFPGPIAKLGTGSVNGLIYNCPTGKAFGQAPQRYAAPAGGSWLDGVDGSSIVPGTKDEEGR